MAKAQVAINNNVATTRFSWLLVDSTMLLIILALLALSAVMVYSSSIALSDTSKFASLSNTFFLYKFAQVLAISSVLVLVVVHIPMRSWYEIAPYLAALTLILLLAVLVVGVEIKGAKRWLSLGFMNFQPAELAKLSMVLYAASYVVRKIRHESTTSFWYAVVPMGIAVAVPGVLLLMEPDLGSTMVIALIAIVILFMGGVKLGGILVTCILAFSAFALSVLLTPWRRERMLAFLDPWQQEYALGKGYQLTHSLIAIGRGEIGGVGLGLGVEKFNWLPEAHTDFIFAVIGEELGLMGVLIVVALFWGLITLIVRIGSIAVRRDQVFSGLVVFGVATWFAIQSIFHMGVNLGMLPTKGLTLPLISYGGSGMIVNLIALALVFRVDFENKLIIQ